MFDPIAHAGIVGFLDHFVPDIVVGKLPDFRITI
jgi:hypothetical protein